MTDYGLNIYYDTKVKCLDEDDLVPQVIYAKFVSSDESASINLLELKGRKAVVYFEPTVSFPLFSGHKVPHKVWIDGTVVYWEKSGLPQSGYVVVFAYT